MNITDNFYLAFFISLLFLLNVYSLSSQSKTIERSGDILLFALPVTTLSAALIIEDTKSSWQFTKALLLTEALTYSLKYYVNKQRPNMSNDNSFPSGHTSTTFQSASFIHKRYGFKYSVPANALAGFTAFSRIEAQKHDGWDILAGAIIGIGSSYPLVSEYQKEHMELTFNSLKNNFLIGFTYKF